MGIPLAVLIVEDVEDDALLLVRELRRGGYDPRFERVQTAETMRAALSGQKWDAIISDYSLPNFNALDALKLLQQTRLDIPFIVVSGTVGEATVLAVMKAGAQDYVMKQSLTRLPAAIERELRDAEVRRESMRLEQQLRQAQKMEAIGRLAGGVAHDFNNLLTIITGYTQLSMQDPNNPDRSNLEQIMKAAERAGALTQQLLAFSRRQALEPKIFDLNELVVNMEKMLRRVLGEDIDLVTLPKAKTAKVKADPNQLEQVIMNLTVNARDALPAGGKITVETANVEMGERFGEHQQVRPGSYVMLAISDNGSGMDAETLSHAFEPFFTTKQAGKGTGLGLATVYGIVRQSGGSIETYSEPGMGTAMKVFLPSVAGETDQQSKRDQTGAVNGSETILVVEDEDSVRQLVSNILKQRGYSVLEASRGQEALNISKSHTGPIELVVTDVVMPEMSGPDMVRKLEKVRPQARVLYMSGYTDEAMIRHGILESRTDFLQKPFLPHELAQKVRRVLDRADDAEDGLS